MCAGHRPGLDGLHRFHILTTRTRQDSDPQALQEALALWRGPALADISGHWADHRRNTLHAERLAAYEDLLHHQLAAGQHAEVVRTVTDLVEDNTPTDRLLLLGAHGLAGSGQHTAIPAWVARVTQRMHDTVDVTPCTDVLDEIDRLIAGPAPPTSWLSPPANPASTADSPADQLAQAVGTRWRRAEEQRQIQDPFPLPVQWHQAPEDVMDHWENIHGAGAGATSSPLALNGQLDQIVDVYRTIPSGRLVVLGRAGSGKTILTGRFVVDLLKSRTSTDAVPVIFSLGSWNPTTSTLRDWLTSQLVRDHPGLAATGPGGLTLAAELVQADRILPVLDGFDEIAEGLHRPALSALNAIRLPLLLTSRTTEYATAVAATDVLTSAAVIELADLTLADLADYLPRTTRKAAANGTHAPTTGWDPVLAELRDHPDSLASTNLAAVLTTPLMVALARTIYSDTPDHNPATLLNTERFSTREALEDHFLGNFILSVYQYQPDNRPTGDHRRWDPDRVQHWLGYLAAHLDHLGTRDLAWWQLGHSMRRPSRTLVTGLVSGLACGLTIGLIWGVVTTFGSGLALGLEALLLNPPILGSIAGIVFGLLHRFGIQLISGNAELEPSRVRIQFFRRTGTRRGRFAPRFMVGFGAGLLFALLLGLPLLLTVRSTGIHAVVALLRYGVTVGSALGLMIGLAVGLMAWLETPIDIRSAVSPTDLLNTNRTAVVFMVLTWTSTFGIGGWLVGEFGGPGGPRNGMALGIAGGASGAIAYGLSLTTWGQWVTLARIWLPLTGRLPWPVHAFLNDAYQRGVLRQAGAVYQFRHARLQAHLTHVFQSRHDQQPLQNRCSLYVCGRTY